VSCRATTKKEIVGVFVSALISVRRFIRKNYVCLNILITMTALFPAAIDKSSVLLSRKIISTTSKIIAIDLDDSFEVDLTTEMELTDNVWTNYIRGVINQLKIKVLNLMDSTVFSAVIFLWVLVYLHRTRMRLLFGINELLI
jgi:hypothetical protein